MGSKVQEQLTVDVQSIYSTTSAFAALKADGSVVSWGGLPDTRRIGDGAEAFKESYSKVEDQLVDVQSICSTTSAFAALKADGSVVAWGDARDQAKAVSQPLAKLQENGAVTSITRNDNAIAALKADGSMVSCGSGGSKYEY